MNDSYLILKYILALFAIGAVCVIVLRIFSSWNKHSKVRTEKQEFMIAAIIRIAELRANTEIPVDVKSIETIGIWAELIIRDRLYSGTCSSSKDAILKSTSIENVKNFMLEIIKDAYEFHIDKSKEWQDTTITEFRNKWELKASDNIANLQLEFYN